MIAIIAGTGTLPLDACKSLLQKNEKFFVVSLFPEDNMQDIATLLPSTHDVITQPFYKVSTVLETLKKRNAKKVLFIGKVDKSNLFKKLKFDWLFFKLAAQVLYKSDKAIMDLLVKTLRDQNMDVLKQSDVLSTLFISPGVVCGKLTPEIEQDIQCGINLAQKMSLHDVGQTVVVKQGSPIAIEAIEGTDQCIKRGIQLAQGNAVICKATRPDQDKKYDLPTLGPNTLKDIKKGEVAALAWQSTHTFIAQKELFIKKAEELGITLVSV